MIKVNEKLALLLVRHNTEGARSAVAHLLTNLQHVPFKVTLALELNQ